MKRFTYVCVASYIEILNIFHILLLVLLNEYENDK